MTHDLGEFPETRWSQLLELRDPAHPQYAEHLEGLVRRYWKPAYHYLRAIRDFAPEDAEDLTQQFFAMLLERGSLERLSPERGSFRGFLKTALRRWAVSAERKAAAGVGRLFRFEEAEALWRQIRDRRLSPEDAFDREWARGLLAEAVARLEKELQAEGKALPFELFRTYCLEPEEPASYEDLARRHGVSLDDVRNSLRAVRQRGRDVLKRLLRDYLLPGENVEEELRFLLSR